MNNNEFDNFLLVRPMIGECKEDDEFHIPIIRAFPVENIEWKEIRATNFTNLGANCDLKNTLAFMFKGDKRLNSLWNNPLRLVPLLQQCALVSQPDFSVHPQMNINEFRHMVYMRNWLGCLWQNYDCFVLPAPCWATPDTYDLCFCGYEKNSTVIVSTIGCQNNSDLFLQGFEEMKKRISPPLIIVYGDMIPGMTGRFLQFRYTDTFSLSLPEQLSLLDSPIFEIKEVA